MADMQRREEEGKERKGEDKGKQGERNKGRGGGKDGNIIVWLPGSIKNPVESVIINSCCCC